MFRAYVNNRLFCENSDLDYVVKVVRVFQSATVEVYKFADGKAERVF